MFGEHARRASRPSGDRQAARMRSKAAQGGPCGPRLRVNVRNRLRNHVRCCAAFRLAGCAHDPVEPGGAHALWKIAHRRRSVKLEAQARLPRNRLARCMRSPQTFAQGIHLTNTWRIRQTHTRAFAPNLRALFSFGFAMKANRNVPSSAVIPGIIGIALNRMSQFPLRENDYQARNDVV
ncbi:hypothetical protein [Paraburkholderia tropica]|uniref:hypothetical protein n=1 Tax=Paraburkholderia tropica TaxID=92647 RepID=UPI002AB270A2|nr:hypothetical protein [Paraburkholderia tropica]